MSKSRVFVYVVIGMVVLAAITLAVVYLPGLMQTLHGTG